MKTINVAIIGYGSVGGHHTELLLKNDKFNITGIYDTDPEKYTVARKNGVKNWDVFHSKEEIASDKNTDTVIISVPNDLHLYYVDYFARAGKNIICEKPVALNSSEYSKMLSVCKKCGVHFIVHQNRRWDRDFLTVKNIFESNAIGKIWRIESRVQGANGIPGNWRKFTEKGGGMMYDWGVHLIDQFVYMLDELPKSVYAEYSHVLGFEVDDAFKLLMHYKSGLDVEIKVDTNAFCPLPRWSVYGLDGSAVIRNWNIEGEIVKPIYDKEIKIAGIVAGNGFTKTMAYRSKESIITEPLPIPDEVELPFYNEYYDVVINDKEPVIKSAQVMAVLKIMEAAQKSADKHKSVKVKY